MIRSNPCERPLATRLIWQCGPGALLPQFRSRALATPVGWVSAIAGMERTKSRTTDKVRTKTRRIAYSFHSSPSVNTYLTGARFTMLTASPPRARRRLCVIRSAHRGRHVTPNSLRTQAAHPGRQHGPASLRPKNNHRCPCPNIDPTPGSDWRTVEPSHLDCPPFGPGRIGRIGWLWYPKARVRRVGT